MLSFFWISLRLYFCSMTASTEYEGWLVFWPFFNHFFQKMPFYFWITPKNGFGTVLFSPFYFEMGVSDENRPVICYELSNLWLLVLFWMLSYIYLERTAENEIIQTTVGVISPFWKKPMNSLEHFKIVQYRDSINDPNDLVFPRLCM